MLPIPYEDNFLLILLLVLVPRMDENECLCQRDGYILYTETVSICSGNLHLYCNLPKLVYIFVETRLFFWRFHQNYYFCII